MLGEEGANVIVELGAPAILACRAIGWPRPAVTWFRGSHMLPLSSDELEQARDNSLLLRSVSLPQLGYYTCQAYNGVARAASHRVALKAFGPVQPLDPNDVTYDQFLVLPPRAPRPPFIPSIRLTTKPAPLPIAPTRGYSGKYVKAVTLLFLYFQLLFTYNLLDTSIIIKTLLIDIFFKFHTYINIYPATVNLSITTQ